MKAMQEQGEDEVCQPLECILVVGEEFIGFDRLMAGGSLRLERKECGLPGEKGYTQSEIGILKFTELIESNGVEYMKE